VTPRLRIPSGSVNTFISATVIHHELETEEEYDDSSINKSIKRTIKRRRLKKVNVLCRQMRRNTGLKDKLGKKETNKTKTNSVALSPRASYTD
jgi:hypothetical protein